ncbi:MAG: PLDc N-terminal domain-containing protein [Candidatus Jordarchaeaceae archaeon]
MLSPLQFGEAFAIPIISIAIVAAIIIVWIVLAVWVYKDANERGMDATIWLLIVLLTGIIGLIIYLVVRE